VKRGAGGVTLTACKVSWQDAGTVYTLQNVLKLLTCFKRLRLRWN